MNFKTLTTRDLLISLAAGLIVVTSGASAAPPDMLLQSANVSGSGNTLNVTRVPVRDSTGKITYKDIELSFDVSNTGVVTLGAGSPVVTTSPSLNVAAFRAGIYKDSLNRHVQVSGPSVLAGGRTGWTMNWIDPGAGAYFNATWATGAVTGHPNGTTLTAFGITTTTYSWGVIGSNNGFLANWFAAYVFGAAQLGDVLTLHYFHNDTAENAAWVFTRCPAGNLC